jgi:hypothetical protein
MSKTKYLKGECQHCSGHLEFPAETIGMVAPCPHCGKETELQLAAPPVEPTLPRKVIIWTAISALILVGGLIIALWGLKRVQEKAALQREKAAAAQKAAQEANPPPEDPIAKAGFQVSNVTLEKTPGSSLVYAVGTVINKSDKQRFAVRIEMDLFDAAGQQLGTAKDYQAIIETNATWKFKALVMDSKAASAKVTSIKEDQK